LFDTRPVDPLGQPAQWMRQLEYLRQVGAE